MKWTCSYGIGDAEMPVGGGAVGLFAAKCTSECVGGKSVSAWVFAGVAGLAVFSPIPGGVAYSWDMELNDSSSVPKKESLEGAVAYSSAGGAAGPGYSCTALRIGSAFGTSCSAMVGVGLGWDNFAGGGAVFGAREKCCK